jgi:hypothetical protein
MQFRFKNNCSIILIIISLLFLLAVNVIKAQTCCKPPSNNWLDPERNGNNAIDIVSKSVNDTIVCINIPFAVVRSGAEYSRFYASSNGSISFGKPVDLYNSKKNELTETQVISSNFGRIQLEYVCPPSCWKYEIIGSAPYRFCAVTWKGFIRINGTCGEYVSFQIKLYETTNAIETLVFENKVESATSNIGPETKNEEISSSQKSECKLKTEENIWTLY